MEMRRIAGFLSIIGLLSHLGCSHPTAEVVFNTSTEAYPVSSDNTGAAWESLGGSATGLPVSSVIRIEMQGIAEAKMQAVWPQALVLRAKEGELRFIQHARCYIQPRGNTGDKSSILVGQATLADLSEDGRNVKFQVNDQLEVADVLRRPFNIVIEIEGSDPPEKVLVFAELTFKARVEL